MYGLFLWLPFQALMQELEKVRNEKRKTEERLKAMENQHRKHQELLEQQAQKASKVS